MLELLALSFIAAVLSGGLCGAIGFHVHRLKITTLSFSVAHAALAGAAVGLILGLDPIYSAMGVAVISALILGFLLTRVKYGGELLSMTVFSVCSAIALFAIYLSNTQVLATSSISVILWGSLLAVTLQKLTILLLVTFTFILYLLAYRVHIDSILYDKKLAEAEGLNIYNHTLAILFFAGMAIASTLKLTGGFLVFTLLYNPVAASFQLTNKAYLQLLYSSLLGSFSASSGLVASYFLDWPVGATIAILSSIILLLSFSVGEVKKEEALRNILKKRNMVNSV